MCTMTLNLLLLSCLCQRLRGGATELTVKGDTDASLQPAWTGTSFTSESMEVPLRSVFQAITKALLGKDLKSFT